MSLPRAIAAPIIYLKPHDAKASTRSPSEDSEGGSAPEVVTDEMMRAGVEAYELFDRADPAEWKVWAVYTEMAKALRQSG